MRESSFFHWEKKNVTGVSTIIRMWRNGAENLAIVSGDSFAMLFGETSPKIRTTIVVTIVETVAPESPPRSLIKSTVARELSPMLTMLLPTRIVESSLSKFSSSFNTSSARLSPFSAIFFMRMRFSEVKEVSVAEK